MRKRKFSDGGIYTAEMGQPPMDPEGVPAKKPAAKTPPPKKTAPPKDTVFREGMPVPQDIDGKSASRKTPQELMQEFRAEKKGIPVDEMRKKAAAEYDKKMKAGEFYGKGGKVKKMSAGGFTRAADGIAQRGKTRGKMC